MGSEYKMEDLHNFEEFEIGTRCPVCLKVKFWAKRTRQDEGYVQCVNCWSIINLTVLGKRLKKNI